MDHATQYMIGIDLIESFLDRDDDVSNEAAVYAHLSRRLGDTLNKRSLLTVIECLLLTQEAFMDHIERSSSLSARTELEVLSAAVHVMQASLRLATRPCLSPVPGGSPRAPSTGGHIGSGPGSSSKNVEPGP
jgi:hypothetical protein